METIGEKFQLKEKCIMEKARKAPKVGKRSPSSVASVAESWIDSVWLMHHRAGITLPLPPETWPAAAAHWHGDLLWREGQESLFHRERQRGKGE